MNIEFIYTYCRYVFVYEYAYNSNNNILQRNRIHVGICVIHRQVLRETVVVSGGEHYRNVVAGRRAQRNIYLNYSRNRKTETDRERDVFAGGFHRSIDRLA